MLSNTPITSSNPSKQVTGRQTDASSQVQISLNRKNTNHFSLTELFPGGSQRCVAGFTNISIILIWHNKMTLCLQEQQSPYMVFRPRARVNSKTGSFCFCTNILSLETLVCWHKNSPDIWNSIFHFWRMVSDGIRINPAQFSQENLLRPEVSVQSSMRYLFSRSPWTPALMPDAERVQYLQEKS